MSELTRLPMACRCGEEARSYWNANRGLCRAALDIEEHDDLVTRLIYELWWTYDAEIVWVGCDQWLGIKVKQWLPLEAGGSPDVDGKRFHVFRIECDTFEDGLVSIWMYFQGGRARYYVKETE